MKNTREMLTITTMAILIIFPYTISSRSKQELDVEEEVFKLMKTYCWPNTFYYCKTYRYFKEHAFIQSMLYLNHYFFYYSFYRGV